MIFWCLLNSRSMAELLNVTDVWMCVGLENVFNKWTLLLLSARGIFILLISVFKIVLVVRMGISSKPILIDLLLQCQVSGP